MKSIIILGAILFSLNVMSKNLPSGYVVKNQLGGKTQIFKIHGVEVIQKDVAQPGSNTILGITVKLNLSVEGNLCTDTSLLSELTRTNKDRYESPTYKLTLRKYRQNKSYKDFQRSRFCTQHSRLSKIRVPLYLMFESWAKTVQTVLIPTGGLGEQVRSKKLRVAYDPGRGFKVELQN